MERISLLPKHSGMLGTPAVLRVSRTLPSHSLKTNKKTCIILFDKKNSPTHNAHLFFAMCILFLAWQVLDKHPLVLLSNRDEYITRPTHTAHFWSLDSTEPHEIFAGKDTQRGGTWLGISKTGRFSAITNFRIADNDQEGRRMISTSALSRGWLVRDFLLSTKPPLDYLEEIHQHWSEYDGFNLIVGEITSSRPPQLAYYSNRAFAESDFTVMNVATPTLPFEEHLGLLGPPLPPRLLPPGIHAMSNHLLQTPWPKLVRGVKGLQEVIGVSFPGELRKRGLPTTQNGEDVTTPQVPMIVDNNKSPSIERLLNILEDSYLPPVEELPDTKIGLEAERFLSSIRVGPGFIPNDPIPYGTVSHTIIIISKINSDTNDRPFSKQLSRFSAGYQKVSIHLPNSQEAKEDKPSPFQITVVEKDIDRENKDWVDPHYSLSQFSVQPLEDVREVENQMKL
jgi:uncharacterized protein with NRDE domain